MSQTNNDTNFDNNQENSVGSLENLDCFDEEEELNYDEDTLE